MEIVKDGEPLRTFSVVDLGCAKNKVDLQVICGHLIKNGWRLVGEWENPSVVVVNTCAFIEPAIGEASDEIDRVAEMKRNGECAAVVVSGCITERLDPDLLVARFPDVDAFMGPDLLDAAPEIFAEALKSANEGGDAGFWIGDEGGDAPCRVFNPPVPDLRLTGKAYAYLKISDGCSHRCSYCTIPSIRGAYRSRRPDAIIKEAKRLLASGVKELNIVAQDPLLYGVDLPAPAGGKRPDIVSLLRELDKIEGDFWIRVLYAYPSEITDRFLKWMAKSPHACKYLDVPLQHTHPKILHAMNRGGAVMASRTVADRIRAAVPGVTLRTTVIVGFPGEGEEEFDCLLQDVKKMDFEYLGVFTFFPEPGTPACGMKGLPPREVADERMVRLVLNAQDSFAAKAEAMVGKVYKALVCETGRARLECQAPDVDGEVKIKGKGSRTASLVGTFVQLRIEKFAGGTDFEGRIV